MAQQEIAAISYSIQPVNHTAQIELTPYLDGDVKTKILTMMKSSG